MESYAFLGPPPFSLLRLLSVVTDQNIYKPVLYLSLKMGNYSKYTLLLGVKLGLEPRVIETNPQWKGLNDKITPQYVLSPVSERDFCEMERRIIKDDRCAYGEKEVARGYVFPNGQIAENLKGDGTFAWEHDCNIDKLCFIEDEIWLGDEVQLLGVALLHHSTSEGYKKGDEKKVLTALGKKDKLVESINQFGFQFKLEDVSLHQYIMKE